MAINHTGARCSDAQNPLSQLNLTGGKYGSVTLARLSVAAPEIDALAVDIGTASFDEIPNLGDFSYNQLAALPPIGACTVFTSDDSATDLLGGDGTDIFEDALWTPEQRSRSPDREASAPVAWRKPIRPPEPAVTSA